MFAVDRGCFLTSSLAAALSLSLTVPMSAIADIFVSQVGDAVTVLLVTSFVWVIVHIFKESLSGWIQLGSEAVKRCVNFSKWVKMVLT